jgi:hypothetical protein
MISWNASDEQMRAAVLADIRSMIGQMTRQAERNEASAADRNRRRADREEDRACAMYSRRQAAHYQQAIDLLTAAPMPAKEDV